MMRSLFSRRKHPHGFPRRSEVTSHILGTAGAAIVRRLFPLIVLLGCRPSPEVRTSALAEIQQRGKLVMLCVPHLESDFVRTRVEAGPMRAAGTAEHFAGRDVELMAAFAQHIGVDLEIRPARGEDGIPSYTALIPALDDGEGDVIASSFSITPARRVQVDFSQPYFHNVPVVIVRRESAITSVDDVRGKVASAVRGSSQEEALNSIGIGSLVYVDFNLENYMAVDEERVDLTLVDAGSAERLLAEFPELRLGPEVSPGDSYGFAVTQGSDLLPELDRWLRQITESGWLQEVIER
jgi:polar amino acid transport system substrate-binding protein